MNVKKGDMVIVISGNDKGREGEVKQAFPTEGRVIVAGVNMRWRHNKPTQQNPKGERLQRETWIHASNVKRVETKSSKTPRGKAKAAKK